MMRAKVMSEIAYRPRKFLFERFDDFQAVLSVHEHMNCYCFTESGFSSLKPSRA